MPNRDFFAGSAVVGVGEWGSVGVEEVGCAAAGDAGTAAAAMAVGEEEEADAPPPPHQDEGEEAPFFCGVLCASLGEWVACALTGEEEGGAPAAPVAA